MYQGTKTLDHLKYIFFFFSCTRIEHPSHMEGSAGKGTEGSTYSKEGKGEKDGGVCRRGALELPKIPRTRVKEKSFRAWTTPNAADDGEP